MCVNRSEQQDLWGEGLMKQVGPQGPLGRKNIRRKDGYRTLPISTYDLEKRGDRDSISIRWWREGVEGAVV